MAHQNSRFVVAASFIAFVFACSAPAVSDPNLEGNLNGGKDKTSGNKTTKSPSSNNNGSNNNNGNGTDTNPTDPTNPADPTQPPTTPGACAAQQGEACFDCCVQKAPQIIQQLDQQWETCICQGACASACGNNACAGQQPSAACDQCLQQNGAQCDQAWETACNGDANCKQVTACWDSDCGGGQAQP